MPDLDAAIEAAARALVIEELGLLAPSANAEFRGECEETARICLEAAAPLIRAQARAEVAEEIQSAAAKIATRAEAAAGVDTGYADGHPFMLGMAHAAQIAREHAAPREES